MRKIWFQPKLKEKECQLFMEEKNVLLKLKLLLLFCIFKICSCLISCKPMDNE